MLCFCYWIYVSILSVAKKIAKKIRVIFPIFIWVAHYVRDFRNKYKKPFAPRPAQMNNSAHWVFIAWCQKSEPGLIKAHLFLFLHNKIVDGFVRDFGGGKTKNKYDNFPFPLL
jgi:hypothetical protein